jgi:hypothetical protein
MWPNAAGSPQRSEDRIRRNQQGVAEGVQEPQ